MLDGLSLLQLFLMLGAVLLLAWPLGRYIARLYPAHTPYTPIHRIETTLYHWLGINPAQEMRWQYFTLSLMGFSVVGFLATAALLMLQGILPLNPYNLPGVSPLLAFNIAASFLTGTNWQAYSPETSLSIFSQMMGLTVQNFIAPACGMAVFAAFTRSLARSEGGGLGNFWVDISRAVFGVLLPLSIIIAITLSSMGVIQRFEPMSVVPLLDTTAAEQQPAEQLITIGPVASQVAIKMLGTNGGGYFNANAAHPFENPTPLSNVLQWIALLIIPAALCFAFGHMVRDARQGGALLASMCLLFIPLTCFALLAAEHSEHMLDAYGIVGTNMEGMETRFGSSLSVIWSSANTATSGGAVTSTHSSLTPLGGMIMLIFMLLGEVVFGGIGLGLCGLLAYVVLSVFLAGLMVGRTPEYLGKKIQAEEIKLAMLILLIPAGLTLLSAALSLGLEAGHVLGSGAHGFTEMFYAHASAAYNNGSAFTGFDATSPYYLILTTITILTGRFAVIYCMLALAGSFVVKNTVPKSLGTMPTHTLLFIILLAAMVFINGLLAFVPALTLGPVAAHYLLMVGA